MLTNAIIIEQDVNEVMFVPSNWFHQVENLEPTISINHNWFNGFNLSNIFQFLFNELKQIRELLFDLKENFISENENEKFAWEKHCNKIMKANKMKRVGILTVGQKLVIPN